jgi:RNA polymerase sporulation-specific sigma factor
LRLVLSVIQRFSNRGENPDDLFQVGCIGLIKSIDNFDLEQNVQFSTYAVPMIIGEVRRYLRDNNSIRVSRSIRDLAYKVLAIKEKYNKEYQKELTIEEIAKKLEVNCEDVVMCLDAIQSPVSLQEPVYGDGAESIYLMDQVKDKKNNDEYWTEKEKNIIRRRFFDGRTQMEVAEEIGISQAQVSRIEKSALSHIKRIYN